MLRILGRLWIGVLLLAVALAPSADVAAAHSVLAQAGDLLLVVGGSLLLSHGLRWAFGQPASGPLRARSPLLALATVMLVVAAILPGTFAEQAVALAAGGLGGYVIYVPPLT